MQEQKYWLGFSLLHEIGPKRIQQLLSRFGLLSEAWQRPREAFAGLGFSSQSVVELLQQHANLDLDHEMARVERVKAHLLTLPDEAYPPLLKPVDDAPPVLYVRGKLSPADTRAICIVGTRKATAYGKDVAYQLAFSLASHGVTVISGLANGIDTAAHQGALAADGRTLAISARGIDGVYPTNNRPLAHEIVGQGAVITEFPLGTKPLRRNFPRRNRIMSGMAHGVVVVEADEKSGSLITAHIAADQGREVYAVPHNIFSPVGRGANRLLQDGATLVLGVEDILEQLDVAVQHTQVRTQTEQIAPETDSERHILGLLGVDPTHVDELARHSGLQMGVVTSTLTLLELKGLARKVGHMQYILAR